MPAGFHSVGASSVEQSAVSSEARITGLEDQLQHIISLLSTKPQSVASAHAPQKISHQRSEDVVVLSKPVLVRAEGATARNVAVGPDTPLPATLVTITAPPSAETTVTQR